MKSKIILPHNKETIKWCGSVVQIKPTMRSHCKILCSGWWNKNIEIKDIENKINIENETFEKFSKIKQKRVCKGHKKTKK